MSFGFFHSRHCAVAMALALSGAGFAELHAAEGRPIEFSPIDGQPAGTNSIEIGSPLSSRMNYLDRVRRPGSLDFRPTPEDYAPAVSSGPVVRSKRRRQSSDLEPTTPEEAFNNYIAREILKLPDSDSDSDAGWSSLMERFNERLWRGRSETNASSPDELSDWRDARQRWGSKGMSGRLSASESASPSLKALKDSSGAESPIRRPVTLSDVFGPATSRDAVSEAVVARKVQQDQIEAFKKVLDFQPPTSRLALSPVGTPSSAVPASANGWAGSPRPSAFGTLPGLTAPSFAPTLPTAPTGPNGLSTVPSGFPPATPVPPPTRLTPPQPVFSVPQRQF